MRDIYRVSGALNSEFIGQITYTIALHKIYRSIDIEFTFDKEKYTDSDLTDDFVADMSAYVRKNYDIDEPPDVLRERLLRDAKTEMHPMAELNGRFIGNMHKQLTDRHMLFNYPEASQGCIPTELFTGTLKVTIVVFNVLLDDTHYALTVRGM